MDGILGVFDSMKNGFNQLVDDVIPAADAKVAQKQAQENAPKPSIKRVSESATGALSNSANQGETDWGKKLQGASKMIAGLGGVLSGSSDGASLGMSGFNQAFGEKKAPVSTKEIEDLGVWKDPKKPTKVPAIPQPVKSGEPSVPPLLKATDEQMAERNMTPEQRQDRDYRNTMSRLESSNRKDVVNKLGYSGKYQFGTLALKDMGIIDMDAPNSNKTMKDAKNFLDNKYGVKSIEDFLGNEKAQDEIFDDWNKKLGSQLESKGAMKYVGKEVNGVKITKHKLLAASHMLGAGAVSKALKNGTLDKLLDGNNHSAVDRMSEIDF